MYKSLFLICLLTTNLIGCTQESEQKQVSANDYKSRAEVFLDGYADIEIVNIASDSLNIESNEPYHDELSYIDTLDAVSGQAKKYKEKDLGLTTVMLTKDDKLDCIIVYKNSMSVETTNHELAHCFYPLVREVIKTKNREILEILDNKLKHHEFITESTAEVVAGLRAFVLDDNFNYIDDRVKYLKSLRYTEDMAIYIDSVPLLIELKAYLENPKNRIFENMNVKEQVSHIIEDFYLSAQYNPNITSEL